MIEAMIGIFQAIVWCYDCLPKGVHAGFLPKMGLFRFFAAKGIYSPTDQT
ncbi:hypothetical protein [Bacillus mesophilum]|nr:hypothetical protein [Bacillus mesophilum]